ncbi:MAG: helix-turn-helix domain-containing protein [Candidatus Aminicenantes bacterium]|nr:helix-turn-helix domain-containing protein [Candidatus Aminicenantes bacterium]NIM78747.1 helix-turn-helix domain-containing protein [Candidatus Aminicenantes bacterium]NIN18002.1 helix-turn-helix domain-containing protein [Candidatus Aminicenantes bacterium]NIN41902.1 helix-turn-helix domain-containing protein [Candidatus Aminicenantes bacterium]NIN84657.1 helix-turn-helix domain-containing protein [Candidatus Aminicenantes bacterium]
MKRKSKKSKKPRLSDRVAARIRNCKNKDYERLTVEKLAEEFEVTPEHLSRVFHRDYYTTIQKFIIHEKVRRGFEIITKSPGITSKKVAEKLDYSDGGSFTKAFKSCFPVTPAKLSRILAEQDKKRKERKKRMEEAAKKNRKVESEGSENR